MGWPSIEYADGYPVDEDFTFWRDQQDPPLDFREAARWLLEELPRASECMICASCDIESGFDIIGEPCKIIRFSTGGWSGAESIIALIERRFDLSHHMESWRRGGHYVFEIPLRSLRDRDAAPRKAAGFEAEGQQPGPCEDTALPETGWC